MHLGALTISWSRRSRTGVSAVERWAVILGLGWLLSFAYRHGRRPPLTPVDAGEPEANVVETARNIDSGLYLKLPATDQYRRDRERLPARLKRRFFGRERTPIPSYIGLLEDPPSDGDRPKVGICCSGGGIRSAAFNLGALQVLQDKGRLHDADYLAAVSGGAYIAAGLSMVAKTPDRDNEDDDAEKENDDSDLALFSEGRMPFYHGSPEEQYLRNRSSYLAPGGVGLTRFVFRVGLGLLANLVVLTLALVLIAWVLATYYRHVHGPLQEHGDELAAGTRKSEVLTAAGVAGIALLLGGISVFLRSAADRVRRALETLGLYLLGLALVIVVATVAIPELLAFLRDQGIGRTQKQLLGSDAVGGAGAAAAGSFGGLLAAVLLELRAKVTIEDASKAAGWYSKLGAPLRRVISRLAAWLVGPLLLLSIVIVALLAMVSAQHITTWGIIAVAVTFTLAWAFADVTAWSLHPFYRRRLCTAFALKRVTRWENDRYGEAREREYHRLVPLSRSGVRPGPGPSKKWPTLLVCAAANVSDPGATPPGRSVTSFTFSPFAMGGPLVGGVPTPVFEKHIPEHRRRDFTLAAAVAMSGAAISPSMGKETRRSFRFLLALANVRLGVWVPNPRRAEQWLEKTRAGCRTIFNRVHQHEMGKVDQPLALQPKAKSPQRFRRRFWVPRPRPWYLVKEMFGWNSVNDRYLYVTDGGHYENLGLVELLRRGCTEIFCFDASGGTQLDALGDAIALARSELDVEIEDLDPTSLTEDDERLAERCCITGRIRYPGGQPGTLVYARSVVTRDAPYDVQAFRIRDDRFPHHSTVDQLYTDEKFEAYRELGAQAGRSALSDANRARAELYGTVAVV